MAAAAVGYRVAEAVSDRAPGLVGGKLQALDLHRVILATVLLGEALHAIGEVAADAAAMGNIVDDPGDVVHLSELQAVVPQAVLVELHGEPQHVAERYRVHPHEVRLVVPVADEAEVRVLQVRPQQPQRLVLRTLDILAVNLHSPAAFDNTGRAAEVSGEPGLREGFTAHRFGVGKRPPLEIVSGQRVGRVTTVDEDGGPILRHHLAGGRVLLENLHPLLDVFLELLGIRLGHFMVSFGGYCLDVLGAHYRARPATAEGPLLRDYAGVEHGVLPGGADHHLAGPLWKLLLGLLGGKPPEVPGVLELHFPVLDVYPGGLGCLSPEDEAVKAGPLEEHAEVAPTVAGENPTCKWRLGGHVEPAGARCPGVHQRACVDDENVLFTQGIDTF